MSRKCSICQHPNRQQIEQHLVSMASYRVVARQFSVGHDSLKRHVDAGHIKASVAAEQVAKNVQRTIDVGQTMLEIHAVSRKVMAQAVADKKTHALALQAVDRLQRQCELQQKMVEASKVEEELEALKQLVAEKWQQ